MIYLEHIDIRELEIRFSEFNSLKKDISPKNIIFYGIFLLILGLFTSYIIGEFYITLIFVFIFSASLNLISSYEKNLISILVLIIYLFYLRKYLVKLYKNFKKNKTQSINFNYKHKNWSDLQNIIIIELSNLLTFFYENVFKITYYFSYGLMIYGTLVGIGQWNNNTHPFQKFINENFSFSTIEAFFSYLNNNQNYFFVIFIISSVSVIYILFYSIPNYWNYHLEV